MNTLAKIKKQISDYPILIYIKGTPSAPSCGFSARAIQVLLNCKVKFKYIDILENEKIRSVLPKYSNWPTFPQLWVNGKLIGGCDIMIKMFNSGELKDILDAVKN